MRSDGAAVLALDVGTWTTRLMAFGEDGRRIAAAGVPTPAVLQGSEATIDVDRLWRTVAGLIDRLGSLVSTVAGLAVTAQLGTVFTDDSLSPTVPARLWADSRASLEAARLGQLLGAQGIRTAGRRIPPESAAAQAIWLRGRAPDAWKRTRRILSLKDYLVSRLTGAMLTDPASASFTGLLDVRSVEWSATLLKAADVSEGMLPSVRSGTTMAGRVLGEAAKATGLPAGLPVAVGGPDGSLGVIGAGGTGDGATVDVAGSTDVLYRLGNRPPEGAGSGLILNAFLERGLWAIGGPTGLTGGAISWLASTLGYGSPREMYERIGPRIDLVPAGAGGLVFRTALSGERLPSWNPRCRGVLAGLGVDLTAAHIVRAAEEGCAFAVAEGIDALRQAGQSVHDIVVVGGASMRPSSLQLRADAWGCEVRTVEEQEASALGAAITAAVAVGLFPSLADAAARMVRPGRTYVPDERRQAVMRQARERWRGLEAAACMDRHLL